MKAIQYKLITLMFVAILVATSASFAMSEESRSIPENVNLSGGEMIFDSSSFQSNIRSGKSLASLAGENSVIGEDETSFGFAAKSDEAKVFLVGTLYSEVLAFVKGGDIDGAVKRLETIEKQFIAMDVPDSLYGYVVKTRSMLQRMQRMAQGGGSMKVDTGACSDMAMLSEVLSMFQPFYEDYARSQGDDMLVLFRAGTWLMDMSLAASGGDMSALKQEGRLNYFIAEMKRMDAPKGVIKSLEDILSVSQNEKISDKDGKKVLKLVQKIQGLLG